MGGLFRRILYIINLEGCHVQASLRRGISGTSLRYVDIKNPALPLQKTER
jgi:hypothetical protein